VVLAIGPERYGVPAEQVQEIQALANLARVPGLPPFWAGVVNLHGRLYPVLNLRRYLGLPGAPPEHGGQVALVTAAGLSVALWVDDVPAVRQVRAADIGPSLAETSEGPKLTGVRGVTRDLLAVLDLGVLLADARLVVQDEIR
jgi:purine-binding chemotaxis protein CheW